MCSANTYAYPATTPPRGMLWRSPTNEPYCGPPTYLQGSGSAYYISSATSLPFRYLPASRLYVSLGPTCVTCTALCTPCYSTTHIPLIPTPELVAVIQTDHPTPPLHPALTTKDGHPGTLHSLHGTSTLPVVPGAPPAIPPLRAPPWLPPPFPSPPRRSSPPPPVGNPIVHIPIQPPVQPPACLPSQPLHHRHHLYPKQHFH